MVEFGEYFNAKMNLLYFILIKLEFSLREHLISIYLKKQLEKLCQTSVQVIWGIFFNILGKTDKDVEIEASEILTKGTVMVSDLLVYLQSWWKEGQKMFSENQRKEEGKESLPLPAEEMIRVDLMLSNISRCIEKLRQIYLQLYLYSNILN